MAPIVKQVGIDTLPQNLLASVRIEYFLLVRLAKPAKEFPRG